MHSITAALPALECAMELNERNLCAGMVKQDVLILASRDDHFIPFRLHREQPRRLAAARSLSDRVFSRQEQAQNHCQIGTIGLALRAMSAWIEASTPGRAS